MGRGSPLPVSRDLRFIRLIRVSGHLRHGDKPRCIGYQGRGSSDGRLHACGRAHALVQETKAGMTGPGRQDWVLAHLFFHQVKDKIFFPSRCWNHHRLWGSSLPPTPTPTAYPPGVCASARGGGWGPPIPRVSALEKNEGGGLRKDWDLEGDRIPKMYLDIDLDSLWRMGYG